MFCSYPWFARDSHVLGRTFCFDLSGSVNKQRDFVTQSDVYNIFLFRVKAHGRISTGRSSLPYSQIFYWREVATV